LAREVLRRNRWLTNKTLKVLEQRQRVRVLEDMATYQKLSEVEKRLNLQDQAQFIVWKANKIELAAKKRHR